MDEMSGLTWKTLGPAEKERKSTRKICSARRKGTTAKKSERDSKKRMSQDSKKRKTGSVKEMCGTTVENPSERRTQGR